jgi:hypothetical protein
MRLVGLGFGLLSALAVAPAAHAASCGSPLDDFNRPDSTSLGSSWTELAQDYSIQGGKVSQPVRTYGTLIFNGVSASEVCVDVTASGSGQTAEDAGVVVGYSNPSDNLVVKLQNNAGAQFDHYYVFRNGTPVTTPPISEGALTPFTSARLRVTLERSPSSSNFGFRLGIDREFDGSFADNHGLYGGDDLNNLASSGRGIGIVSYGPTKLDNFTATDPVFAPASIPPAGGPAGSTGSVDVSGAVDKTKPTLGSLSFSSTTFAAAKSGASTAKKRKAKVGTKVSFNLSEASSVEFTVQRKTTGRRVSRKCKTKKKSNAKKPKCTLWKNVTGSFTYSGKAGKNTFTFRGRIGGKSLKAGSYRLNSQATDTAKNTSATKTKAFKIVK